ncbi:MAG: hypothetical protein RML35_05135 [Chloroherpetonaceae bacterium]|nr:hypothetical protein [Chloroherpetonaceae bacterium]
MPSEALSVSGVATIQPAKAASPTLDTLPKLDLSPWKERFSKLVEETPYRPKSSTARPTPLCVASAALCARCSSF